MVWLGDNERGLSWFAESDEHWTDADTPGAIDITRENDRVILRLRIVRSPVELTRSKALHYAFGFQATPVKKVEKTCWDYRFASCPRYGHDLQMFAPQPDGKGSDGDTVAELGARTTLLLNWTSWFAYPEPTPDRVSGTREYVTSAHARGLKVIPYLGYALPVQAPEHAAWGEEFIRKPQWRVHFGYPDDVRSPTDWVCLASRWQDLLVAKSARSLRDYDFDGFYLDTTVTPLACCNAHHGCGYVRDGQMRSTYPVFATRTAFQRLYSVVRAGKPDGLVDAHVYDCMNSSALSFATSYWNGEQLPNARGKFLLDVLPLDRFRTEFMGHQWGVPAEFLHYHLEGYEKCLGLALLHDVMTRAHARLDDLRLNAKIWQAADAFGRAQAEWLPYWRNAGFVTLEPQGASASLYRHATNGVLLIVNNTTRDPADVTIRLNCEKLGYQASSLTATNVLTDKPVALDNGTLKLPLASMGWEFIWLKPSR